MKYKNFIKFSQDKCGGSYAIEDIFSNLEPYEIVELIEQYAELFKIDEKDQRKATIQKKIEGIEKEIDHNNAYILSIPVKQQIMSKRVDERWTENDNFKLKIQALTDLMNEL